MRGNVRYGQTRRKRALSPSNPFRGEKMKFIALAFVTLLSTQSFAATHVCASLVPALAEQLFYLHNPENQDPVSYTTPVQKPSLKSPDGRRRYAVLETKAQVGHMG